MSKTLSFPSPRSVLAAAGATVATSQGGARSQFLFAGRLRNGPPLPKDLSELLADCFDPDPDVTPGNERRIAFVQRFRGRRLQPMANTDLAFDLEITGFETAEIDLALHPSAPTRWNPAEAPLEP